MDVVVAASSNNFQFAVIDFTNPSSPLVIKVNPNLGGSCVVDVDGALAAVGNANGDQVALYDISDPSVPLLLGSVKSGLAGIGALSLDNSRVLAGEANGLRVALLDFTSPGSAKIVSTLVTRISSIGSASLSGVHGVVAGPNDPTVDVLDFTNPAAPTRASLDPSLRGPLVADLDGTQIAIGDQGGSVVVLANAVSRTILGTADTKLPSLGSISIAGSLVTVGTPNDVRIALVDFTTPGSPVVITANPALGGGATVVMGARIAAGAILSTSVKLLQRSGGTLTVLGTANSGISSISTIGIGTFTPPPPKPGKVTVNPTSLSFGNVSVCMSSGPQTLTVRNAGAGKLNITSIAATGPYALVPAAVATTLAPNATLPVTVTFTPTAQGPAPGTIAIHSDDPTDPALIVHVTGVGTPPPPPAIQVKPSSLSFGASLPGYFFGLRIVIANTSPCTPLNVTQLSTGNPVFPVTSDPNPTTVPATLSVAGGVVGPNSQSVFVVVFAPPLSVGAFSGSLVITSNDPVHPSVTVSLAGQTVLAKPSGVGLVLDRSDYMDFDVAGGSRVELLRSAVLLFLDLMPEEQGDFIGSSIFEYIAHRLTRIAPSNAATKHLIRQGLAALGAGYGSSIAAGMISETRQLVDDLPALNPAVSPTRLIMLVFTAGRERTAPLIKDVEPSILSAGIEIYAIALGSGSEIDSNTLSRLAASSKGRFFSSEDGLLLRKNFVQVLADAFRMNMAADPIATISRGHVQDVPMKLTKCERRLRFLCTWEDLDDRLELTLSAPDGTLFTPVSGATNHLVRYATQPGSALFDLMLPPLGDDDVIGPQVVGTWHLHVDGRHLQHDTERFSTALLVESPLELRHSLTQAVIASNSILYLDLLDGGHPVPNASITVTFGIPVRSAQEVRIQQYRQNLAQRDTAARTISASDTIPMRYETYTAVPTRDFRYAVDLSEYVRDGIYQIVIEAHVPACAGIGTRYAQFGTSPFQLIDPYLSDIAIQLVPGPGDPVEIRFTPRDTAFNLLGMGLAQVMHVNAPEGNVVERMVDRFDGSYVIRMARPAAVSQEVKVDIAGQTLRIDVPARPGPLSGCWLIRCLSTDWRKCWHVVRMRLERSVRARSYRKTG